MSSSRWLASTASPPISHQLAVYSALHSYLLQLLHLANSASQQSSDWFLFFNLAWYSVWYQLPDQFEPCSEKCLEGKYLEEQDHSGQGSGKSVERACRCWGSCVVWMVAWTSHLWWCKYLEAGPAEAGWSSFAEEERSVGKCEVAAETG